MLFVWTRIHLQTARDCCGSAVVPFHCLDSYSELFCRPGGKVSDTARGQAQESLTYTVMGQGTPDNEVA